ncbi:DUF6056 family protein [Limosilactobacillus fastidiosus]|uniref:Uncharacterized protein n=1 Tax=Limosilactobacillus fastidiosus TaxID=2759855 RepID=A0ABR6E689_9LACO|nr:DUF6056 family protein [Limosilactobacillus fastidiosus]MBB1062622.1 hypothetical protein [Limosilactobacillus fastidiosus]MCD7083975.1 DUF6056 family protein [Limosilactobacillus fastidiosus]
MSKKSINKITYLIWLIFMGCVMFVWNYKTPYMNEDLDLALSKSFGDILKEGCWDYVHWNGRFFGQTFSRILMYEGRFLGSLTAAIFFVALIIMIAKLTQISVKNQFFPFKIILLTSFIFLFTPDFGSVYIWRAGTGNYLITMVIFLCFLYLFINDDNNIHKWLSTFLIILTGFVSGLGNENTSGGIIFACLSIIFLDYLHNRKFNPKQILGLVAVVTGFLILIFSPGDKARLIISHPDFLKESIVKRIYTGLLQILSYLYNNPVIIILICLVLVGLVSYFYCISNDKKFEISIIFTIAGVLSILVMSISPEGQSAGRTYFGAFIFFIIALFNLVPAKLNNKYERIIGISGGLIIMLLTFITVGNGLQQARIFNTQLNDRYQYILMQKRNGKTDINLSHIDAPNNRYSLIGSYIEVGNNVENFPNGTYHRYFGVNVKVKN